MENENKNMNEFDNQENIDDLENQNSNQELNKVETTEINVDYENKEEEPKKNNTLAILLIVFMILSLVFGGYIFYDKVIRKNEDVPKEPVPDNNDKVSELVKFNISQFLERYNVTEDGKEYFNIMTYENSKLKIDFRFYTEKENSEAFDIIEHIKADVYINNVKNNTMELEQFYHCDDCNKTYSSLKEAEDYSVELVKSLVGTIKGDKYYVYFIVNTNSSPRYANLYIVNEKGNVITNNVSFYNGYGDAETIIEREECETYKYAKVVKATDSNPEFRLGNYFILDDSVYYFDLNNQSVDNWNENNLADEYKLTVEADAVSINKVGSCHIDFANRRG